MFFVELSTDIFSDIGHYGSICAAVKPLSSGNRGIDRMFRGEVRVACPKFGQPVNKFRILES